jgi:hypothetical protein
MDELEMALLNAAANYVAEYDDDAETWPEDQAPTLRVAHSLLTEARLRYFGPHTKHLAIRLAQGRTELRYKVAEVSPGRWGYELSDGSGVGMGYSTAGQAACAAEQRAGWETEA